MFLIHITGDDLGSVCRIGSGGYFLLSPRLSLILRTHISTIYSANRHLNDSTTTDQQIHVLETALSGIFVVDLAAPGDGDDDIDSQPQKVL